jgi:hypothetical protein
VSDQQRRARRAALSRTVKACGPGTRCWCQVSPRPSAQPGADEPAIGETTVARRIRRRERAIAKTTAQGRPDDSGASAVNTRAHTKTTQRARGCGCIGHPAFPAPSLFRGTLERNQLGASSLRVQKLCLMSFRGDSKHRTRNLEILRCAIAHRSSLVTLAPRNDGLKSIALLAPAMTGWPGRPVQLGPRQGMDYCRLRLTTQWRPASFARFECSFQSIRAPAALDAAAPPW